MGSSVCKENQDAINVVELPSDVITIVGQYDDSVEFSITQSFDDVVYGMALEWTDKNLTDHCDGAAVMESNTVIGGCEVGVTTVTLVVYFAAGFSNVDCRACDGNEFDFGGKFCVYNIEIPCEVTSVECGEPSAAPSDVPSSSPSLSSQPSSVPSSLPSLSLSPSNVPGHTPSFVPSDMPSILPSDMPSTMLSVSPSNAPSHLPSDAPSHLPSDGP